LDALNGVVNRQQETVNKQHKKAQMPVGNETSFSFEDFYFIEG
jgi:hypothetical protein